MLTKQHTCTFYTLTWCDLLLSFLNTTTITIPARVTITTVPRHPAMTIIPKYYMEIVKSTSVHKNV